MKKLFTLLFIVLQVSMLQYASAQERALGGPARQKLENLKIAYLTRQMHLSTEEARIFWPLYDAYQADLEKLKRDRRHQLEEIRENFDGLNDEKANAILDKRLEQASDMLRARQNFVAALRKQLPAKKVLSYFRAEEMFQKELTERASELRQERRSERAGGLRRN